MINGVPFLDLTSMHEELRIDIANEMSTVVDANAFIGGRWVEHFEAEFADFCDTRHCVGVANGTDALALILRGLGIGPGDEVILPANTFIATAEAVLQVGATPVFADVEPSRLLMTAADVAPHLSNRTAACIVVHLFGLAAKMDEIVALCARAGIALIEDAAQAHGADWGGQRVGSFGVAAGFSFYPGKNLGAFGDGGAVTTNDGPLAMTIRSLSNHGRSEEDRYLHEHVGLNSRLDGLQAAILFVKLGALDRWNSSRRAAHVRYLEQIESSEVKGLGVDPNAADVHHLEVIRVPDRDRVQRVLTEAVIGTGVHYPVPCHLQPAYGTYRSGSLPVVEAAAREILSLPMFPHLTTAQVDRVCEVLASAAVL